VELIQQEFTLHLGGVHGISHWMRVRDNGLRLGELTGANPDVVELFTFLHDSKRFSDGADPEHGRRAAEFAEHLQGSVFTLSNKNLALLTYACEFHSKGLVEADITVQTCWAADREWIWQYVFPSKIRSQGKTDGIVRRYHISPATVQKAV
jgi:uncharacterized protein